MTAPIIIRHRCNDLAALRDTPSELGVEIDLRTDGKNLILAHDPLMPGTLFVDWVKEYDHRFIILNVKEEGLESVIKPILDIHSISEYFYLDQTFPFLLKSANSGERRCAVR
ncbi:MAG: hypothetical protein VW875_18855, partial [Planctomycetaceae bacterium]